LCSNPLFPFYALGIDRHQFPAGAEITAKPAKSLDIHCIMQIPDYFYEKLDPERLLLLPN